MTHYNTDDMSKILDFLTRNDRDISGVDLKNDTMESQNRDAFLSDSWPTGTDDLLENIFSLEGESLNFLDQSMPDFSVYPDHLSQPSNVSGSSCSDSGLSSDQADFDFEQQLSPFLIQNSCDGEKTNSSVELKPPKEELLIQDVKCSSDLSDSIDTNYVVEEPFDVVDFEHTVMPGFINNGTFQNTGKNSRKRRLSQTPSNMAIVQPKVQRPAAKKSNAPAVVQKPQLVVRGQPQKPLKMANIQVIHPQPRVVKTENVTMQRKVIRVAPMNGNPRSILLPVTIKDMKDLKSIKIINASDLKNASNIKLAAANLLSQTKTIHDFKNDHCSSSSANDFEYDSNNGTNCDDSGSEPDDEDDGQGGEKQYPRLMLTGEERRLLSKEGIALPGSYPLTKHEERELKRIRRKIRNKISAQDSRKRKKEYVDGLEDRVKQCTAENMTLIKRIKILQSQNQSLTAQLKRLQNVLTGATSGSSGNGSKTAQPATCLLVLLLSVALVALPSLRDGDTAPAPLSDAAPAQRRVLLSHSNNAALDEVVLDDGEFNMEELITFNRPHSDHDYQLIKRVETPKALSGGYLDIPIDEDWPPNLKKRMKEVQFDFEDGHDYLPPIIKEENYENFYDSKIDVYEHFNLDKLGVYDKIGPQDKLDDNFLLGGNMVMSGGKLIEFVGPPIAVKTEDIITEEVDYADMKNMTEIRSFVVNSTLNNF